MVVGIPVWIAWSGVANSTVMGVVAVEQMVVLGWECRVVGRVPIQV